MPRRTLVFAVALPLLAVSAPSTHANPCPIQGIHSIPAGIRLVGLGPGGVPDPAGTFTVTVRDRFGNPCVNTAVTISFADCAAGDIRLGSVQPAAGQTLYCPDQGVNAVTDAAGLARFTIVGGASNIGGNSPGASGPCARIYADGIALGSVTVATFDENGVGGVDGADVAAWLSDRFDADYEGRSDFNFDGQVDGRDLVALMIVRFGNGSSASSAAYCP